MKIRGAWLMIGGGLTASIAAFFAMRKSAQTTEAIKTATDPAPASPPEGPVVAPQPLPTASIHATGYWPYAARPEERTMEGGTYGAAVWRGARAVDPTTGKRPVLYTLEMFQAGKAPYVSVSGDPEIWPFGQRLSLSSWPGVTFRVVDTGGHFTGSNKVYRAIGEEPLDICVASRSTKVPSSATATIHRGDSFSPKQALISTKFKDQTVAGDDMLAKVSAAEALLGAYYDALERDL